MKSHCQEKTQIRASSRLRGNTNFDGKAVALIRERHDSFPQTAAQTFLQGTLVSVYSIQHKPGEILQ